MEQVRFKSGMEERGSEVLLPTRCPDLVAYTVDVGVQLSLLGEGNR